MDVMMKLTANGAKASSNPSVIETIMDKNMNKALTSNALPTFEDIAFIFIRDIVKIGYCQGKQMLIHAISCRRP